MILLLSVQFQYLQIITHQANQKANRISSSIFNALSLIFTPLNWNRLIRVPADNSIYLYLS